MHPSTRAFQLIELLVVIAIIALLIAMLVPALGSVRLAARRGVSAANLGSLARVQVIYAADFNNSFVNPFSASTPSLYPGLQTFSGPVSFATTILPSTSQTDHPAGLDLRDAARSTEPFSHTWGSFMSHYMDGTDQGQRYLWDPSDPLLPQHGADQRAAAWISSDEYLFDTSYWYSPVFWLQSNRYRTEQMESVGPGADQSRWLARNTFADVPIASHKALLFERFDWSTKQRVSSGGGMRPSPPQWNNSQANPQVAFVDGSVSRVRMAELHALGENSDPSISGVYRPSGLFNPTEDYSYVWLLGPLTNVATQDPYETGTSPFTDTVAWRQYLYATRNGVRGMDVNKR